MGIRNDPVTIPGHVVPHHPVMLLRQSEELLKVQSPIAVLIGQLQHPTGHSSRHFRALLVAHKALHLRNAQISIAVCIDLYIVCVWWWCDKDNREERILSQIIRLRMSFCLISNRENQRCFDMMIYRSVVAY